MAYLIIVFLFSLYYFMNINRYFAVLTIFPLFLSTIFYTLIMYYEFYCIGDYDRKHNDYIYKDNYNCGITISFILNAPSFFSYKFINAYITLLFLQIIYLITHLIINLIRNGIILLSRICV